MPADLSKLPAPNLIEALDYETLLSELLNDYQTRYPAFSAVLESEPVVKLLEVFAYRELLLRARINDAAHGVMLAYATGSDLDHIAANVGVYRLCLNPGDPKAMPPVPATYESDTDLRARTQLAPEGWSTAGSTGAYIFHAKSAHPDVKDVAVLNPKPGEVHIFVLSQQGDGTSSPALLSAVELVLLADTIRPLTDFVMVFSATIKNFTVEAALSLEPGVASDLILATAREALKTYLDTQHRLQGWVTRSGIFAALHVEGVQKVTLKKPHRDLYCQEQEAPFCSMLSITQV